MLRAYAEIQLWRTDVEQRRILIIDGHPDPDPGRFVHALAAVYKEGAAAHDVHLIRIADLKFPVLTSPKDWTEDEPHSSIIAAQGRIKWAQHIVILYPLWLGDMPARLKAFFEQAFRPDFAFKYGAGMIPDKMLGGRSARVIITMGTPSAAYEFFYFAHSVRSLERNILKFVGIGPVRRTIIGAVASSAAHRLRWLEKVRKLGAAGA